jgi:hypothetical protein
MEEPTASAGSSHRHLIARRDSSAATGDPIPAAPPILLMLDGQG